MTYPCAVWQDLPNEKILPFPDTVAWRLWTLYGWVSYNFTFGLDYNFDPPRIISCGDKFTGNALFDTVGKDVYQTLADSYRLDPKGLQYNYLNETDPTQWFPLAGSAATNEVILTIDSAPPNVFYRLVHSSP